MTKECLSLIFFVGINIMFFSYFNSVAEQLGNDKNVASLFVNAPAKSLAQVMRGNYLFNLSNFCKFVKRYLTVGTNLAFDVGKFRPFLT